MTSRQLNPPETPVGKSFSSLRQVRPRSHLRETIIHKLLFVCALVSIMTTIGIVVMLVTQTAGFFSKVSPLEFFTGTKWTPLFQPQHFGVLPLVGGTLLTAGIAIMVALPIGLASAIYLSEYAKDRVRRVVKPLLEILAGIPTVVYGYFALTFVTPLLRNVFPNMIVFNALSAGLVMGVMIIPMISSLSEDAMVAVPRSLRDAAYGLGATRFEVATRVVMPAAVSGIVAACILALSRAVGETMIVAIAAGSTPKLTLNPLESIQTMTAYIVQISLGETPHGTLEYYTIFAVALLLFVMTLLMNLFSQWFVRRYREKY
ncbi:MAG: phosphate ABC transporter permease subunit PstC [Dehalococcoidales bacterium]|nr:phosphate ABC transporter permease subunit PstC [Dehalococcoidales bacterium]